VTSSGAGVILRTLLEHDFVDELRLSIYPVVFGVGERVLGEISNKKPMRLVDTKTTGGDVAHVTSASGTAWRRR
jgi:dihydrofolate reductase